MDAIRSYLIKITVAALISGAIVSMVDKKSSMGMVIKMMCGVFMTLTLLSPLVKIRLMELPDLFAIYETDVDAVVEEGKEYAQDTIADIIIQRTEAYILDEAELVGADITVEVKLNANDIPVPCGVKIRGSVSPYGKSRLQQIIKEELGIPEEEQIWVD